jgi:hypothetical protein
VVEQVVVEVLSVNDPDARAWPEPLRPYADAVAEAAGPFQFEAASIELVDAQEMATQLAIDIPDINQLPPDVAEAVRRFDDVHRAWGIATIKFDVLESNRATALQIEGLYDQSQHRILLRTPSLDAELAVDQQELLVHEIVHAWQGPARVRALAGIATDQTVAGALIEGEAERIAHEWRKQQSLPASAPAEVNPDDRQAASLIAETQVRYELGRRLHLSLDQIGGIDAAIAAGRLIDGSALVDPNAWIDRPNSSFVRIDAPAIDGASPLPEITPPISAPHWLQVFASANDFPEALAAARTITSTSSTTVWTETTGATCVATRVAGDPLRFGPALRTWQAAAPAHRTITIEASGTLVEACDPGVGQVPAPLVAADEAIRRAGQVIDGERWATEQGREPLFGACRVHDLSSSALIDAETSTAEVEQALDQLDPGVCGS